MENLDARAIAALWSAGLNLLCVDICTQCDVCFNERCLARMMVHVSVGPYITCICEFIYIYYIYIYI